MVDRRSVHHRRGDSYAARLVSAVAIIPARGGSRRIPGKNIKPFLGKPMLAYSVAAAKVSDLFDAGVYVSTEDQRVAEVSLKHGSRLHARQKEFAEDGVGTQEVMRLALMELFPERAFRPEYACCIYPCAPNLLPEDLRTSFKKLERSSQYVVAEGIFYFGRTDWFLNMEPLERVVKCDLGQRHIDINVQADWDEAERVYRRRMYG